MSVERQPGEAARIEQSLRLAGLWAAVAALPAGLETIVGSGFGGVVMPHPILGQTASARLVQTASPKLGQRPHLKWASRPHPDWASGRM
jgi:hypothetical protein